MATLESILVDYFGCKAPFNADGKFTKDGCNAYSRLLDLVYDLSSMGVINAESVTRTLDQIADE